MITIIQKLFSYYFFRCLALWLGECLQVGEWEILGKQENSKDQKQLVVKQKVEKVMCQTVNVNSEQMKEEHQGVDNSIFDMPSIVVSVVSDFLESS